MGPFRLGDRTRCGRHAGQNFIDDFPTESTNLPSFRLFSRVKDSGRKLGQAFARKRKATPDPEGVDALVAKPSAPNLPLDGSSAPTGLSPQDIAEMIFFPVVNEACRV